MIVARSILPIAPPPGLLVCFVRSVGSRRPHSLRNQKLPTFNQQWVNSQ
jgi:hypothetical protein